MKYGTCSERMAIEALVAGPEPEPEPACIDSRHLRNLTTVPHACKSLAHRVYDLLAPSGDVGGGQGCVLCEIAAHKAPLAALAWSADGRLLASASTQGTVVRVHRWGLPLLRYKVHKPACNSLAFIKCTPDMCSGGGSGAVTRR